MMNRNEPNIEGILDFSRSLLEVFPSNYLQNDFENNS